jgi:TolA-binding protein
MEVESKLWVFKVFFAVMSSVLLGIMAYIIYRILKDISFRKNLARTKRNIMEKIFPGSMKEAFYYEIAIEMPDIEPVVCATGSMLLLNYYYDNSSSDSSLAEKALRYGERIRSNFTEYSFYEDAMFTLAGIYYFRTREPEAAKNVYSELIKTRPKTKWKGICTERISLIGENLSKPDALMKYIEAESHFESANYKRTEELLLDTIEKYPSENIAGTCMFFLADIYYYKYDDYSKALDCYMETYKKYPKSREASRALYKVGEIFRRESRWNDAMATYEGYVMKYPDSIHLEDAEFYIGECHRMLGNLREAKNVFSRILGDFPESKWTEVIYKKVQEINRKLNI